MRTIERRLGKLENRFGLAQNQTLCRFMVSKAGRDFGGTEDTYLQILEKAGFSSANGFGVGPLDQGTTNQGTGNEETLWRSQSYLKVYVVAH